MKNLLKASICICFLYGGSVYGQPGLGLIPSDRGSGSDGEFFTIRFSRVF